MDCGGVKQSDRAARARRTRAADVQELFRAAGVSWGVGFIFDQYWEFVFVQCCLAVFYVLIVLYLVCKEISRRR